MYKVWFSQEEPEQAFYYLNAEGEYVKENKHYSAVLEIIPPLFGL